MPIGGTAFYGQNQHPRITTNYLNQLNRHGDPGAGVPVSTAQVSGSIVQEYLGFAGGKLTITNPWAPQFADPAVGPLYGGIYMYVRLDPKATAPLSRGQIVFWLDELHYLITGAAKASTGQDNKIAGVAINQTLPGYWDFIQIAGIASVMISGFIEMGDPASVDTTLTPAQAIAATVINENFLGFVVLTPAMASTVSTIELNLLQGLNF